jgi:hypothetical protein
MTREPFDTPAARAAQGERKLTHWVKRKIPFVLSRIFDYESKGVGKKQS